MEPLIDSAAVARVDRIVEDSASCAKVIVRGGPVTDGSLASGAFYRPSLIEVEDIGAPIIQQEIFGPVATFEVFDGENDAIHRANATEFGLAAAVFTRDVARTRRVSRQINAGTVWTRRWVRDQQRLRKGKPRPPARRPRTSRRSRPTSTSCHPLVNPPFPYVLMARIEAVTGATECGDLTAPVPEFSGQRRTCHASLVHPSGSRPRSCWVSVANSQALY